MIPREVIERAIEEAKIEHAQCAQALSHSKAVGVTLLAKMGNLETVIMAFTKVLDEAVEVGNGSTD